MPAGDPAGYLPNVLKARKRKGQPAYQPRGKRKRGEFMSPAMRKGLTKGNPARKFFGSGSIPSDAVPAPPPPGTHKGGDIPIHGTPTPVPSRSGSGYKRHRGIGLSR